MTISKCSMNMATILEYNTSVQIVFDLQRKLFDSFDENHSSKFLKLFILQRFIKSFISKIVSDPSDLKLILMSQTTPH